METKFIVSTSPHIRTKTDTGKIMWMVVLALLPALLASIYLFGLPALSVIAASVSTCLITEAVTQKCLKRRITLNDGSALVTGILFAFTLPPTLPLWMAVVGGVLAIFLVKQLFGGLGYNIFNPALASRAILIASWPSAMTAWTAPVFSLSKIDARTCATPLNIVKMGLTQPRPSYLDLFMGNVPGSLGETCKLALLIGAVILLATRIIDWRTPVSFMAVVAGLSAAFGRDPLFEILSGGLILGAFFMATDMVTTPTTRNGRLLFGAGCGLITSLIRNYGGFPEGVCYSILLMNCLVPLIDRYVQPPRFGTR